MNIENITELSENEKKDILKDIIMNDVSHWKKVLVLMQMEDNKGLLDVVLDNKRTEIDLLEQIIGNKIGGEIPEFNIFSEEYSTDGFSFAELANRDISNIQKDFINNDNLKEKYGKACKEVSEFIKYIPGEFYNKIDKNFLSKLDELVDSEYEFTINSSANLSAIHLKEETKDLLALMLIKYWSKIVNKNEVQENIEDNKISNEELPILKSNLKWYQRIFNFLLKAKEGV